MKCCLASIGTLVVLLTLPASAQDVPPGYPADYSKIIANAKAEGSVLIYSSTDSSSVLGLIEQFKKTYPGIAVDFLDLSSNEVYTRLTSETAAGVKSADLVWAGADTVSQLVEGGLAMPYKTPESANLIDGAVWKDAAFGVTIEPISIIYNPRLIDQASVPATHGKLTELLKSKSADLKGKVATLDPRRSAAGVAYGMADAKQDPEGFKKLVGALGATSAVLYSSTSSMVEKVVSGEHSLAYNVAGSSVVKTIASSKGNLAMALPCDYTLHLVRTMMIPAKAAHSNAAKLFLDFTYSRAGQEALKKVPFASVRKDVDSDAALAMPAECADARVLLSPGEDRLLTFKEQPRAKFLTEWQSAFAGR